MAGLLSADAIAVLRHVFIDKAVADSRLFVADFRLVKRLVQTEIAHDGRYNLVAGEPALFLELAAKDVDDFVAVHDLAVFIDRQAAIRVAVVGKADIQMVFHNEAAQTVDVGRAGSAVDVHAVRLGVDDKRLCAEGFEHRAGDVPRAAVRAVQTDAHILIGMGR